MPPQPDHQEYEIERDMLLGMLYDLVKTDVTFLFGDTVMQMQETDAGVAIIFKNGAAQEFNMVFGCDGVHSEVRRLWFGHESDYVRFLGVYFSITIVEELLIPEFTTQMYSEPGKTIMLNAYNGKTEICFCFRSEKEIDYNYRDDARMRNIMYDALQNTGWRTPELIEKVKRSDTFYFDKLCHIKMPSWFKGRVALIGDAGYCPSPAAGRGGSIAIDGAAALYDAFVMHKNYKQAFAAYDTNFRPFIEELQKTVIDFNLDILIPKTEQDIQERLRGGFSM